MAYLSWSVYSILLRDLDAPSFPSLRPDFGLLLKNLKKHNKNTWTVSASRVPY